ncbi:restriction endonuclease subunit S [Rheinheimera baltica]|uniref:restriction endonuclease subunit S n=1 Tax=Rheinheimera baltica TaxID=67576 RepID=UPI00040EB563|nr:restriction endonuclease subunit S [Rheinheimera baltica]
MELQQVAEIISGRTFKHGVKEFDDWTHAVVQIRDVFKNPHASGIAWGQLSKSLFDRKVTSQELKKNDILVIAKGMQKTAILLGDIPFPTIVNQHFFIIRVKDTNTVHPEFLQHFLNSEISQQWLLDNSSGQHQNTMSKTVLSQLEVPTVPLEQQISMAEFAKFMSKEISDHQTAIAKLEDHLNSMFLRISDEDALQENSFN